MKNQKVAAWVATLTVIASAIILFLLFPEALAFVELAAQEIRFFWWLILLVARSTLFLYLVEKSSDDFSASNQDLNLLNLFRPEEVTLREYRLQMLPT